MFANSLALILPTLAQAACPTNIDQLEFVMASNAADGQARFQVGSTLDVPALVSLNSYIDLYTKNMPSKSLIDLGAPYSYSSIYDANESPKLDSTDGYAVDGNNHPGEWWF